MKDIDSQNKKSNDYLVSQLEESSKKIHSLTYFNSITNLPNRVKLTNIFRKELKVNREVERAIFSVDIDRFHSINELYGREIGDQLLILIGERLKTIFCDDICVYHDGVDEFFVYLRNIGYEEIEKKGQDILEFLAAPFKVKGHIFYITASIGISHYPTTGITIEQLLDQAEIAMFKVKKSLRNNYQVFLPHDAKVMVRRNQIELDMQKALDNEELYLNYQPKVDIETGKLIAVEALIRWNHPLLGVISPGEFIPVAEETGMIIDIGYWVICEAVKQTKEWHDLGYHVHTAINVSAKQLEDNYFVAKLLEILNTFHINPKYLIVEITESVFKNFRQVKKIISDLKANGIRIALDDFGTGYSSFGVLKEDFIDMIKIDKSFIDDIPENNISSILVSTMIRMGEDMELNMIAEGVEDSKQVEYLLQKGCKLGQGYLFSRPIEADQILDYIKENGCTC